MDIKKRNKRIYKLVTVMLIAIICIFMFSSCMELWDDKQDEDYGWTSIISGTDVYNFISNYLILNQPNNAWYIDDINIDSKTPVYINKMNDWIYCVRGTYKIPDKEHPDYGGSFKSFCFALCYDNVQKTLYIKDTLDDFYDVYNIDISYGYTDEKNRKNADVLAKELFNNAKYILPERVSGAVLISVEKPTAWWDPYPKKLNIKGTYYIKSENEIYKGIVYKYNVYANYNKYYDRYDYSITRDYGAELY